MKWVFLLLLLFRSSGADDGTLCTSDACYTLHKDEVNFNKATNNCFHNGGYLMTVRDREEEDVLRSLLSQVQDGALRFWIGLKLHKGDCVLTDKPLRGFKWVSGEAESSYSNWEKEPVDTCTERCVRLSYSAGGENRLRWVSGACKVRSFYVCKFYFRGMCGALTLLGSGRVTYIAPFSEEPLRSSIESLPLGTYAKITCRGLQSYTSVCTGTERWTLPGPFCKQLDCTSQNGGCEHVCHQEAEKVRCSCREGYHLRDDGVSCQSPDPCAVSPCEHRCVADHLGFSCECDVGYELERNQRNCTDVDECQSQVCPGQVCVNTPGGFRCQCEVGFKMLDGECTDVDECRESRCSHSCWNTIGSFSCFCDRGFALAADGFSCEDVDECASHRCLFQCINTQGGYVCTCPLGFRPTSSGHACLPELSNQTLENMTERPDQVQHPSTFTDLTLTHALNLTLDRTGNATLAVSFSETLNTRVLVCVLGSVLPLLLLITVTVAVAIYRCRLAKKEAKKNATTDGYCWVSSGLDPRLEKLYESILTDDL
ncbi:complement component C1q receptor-like [Synchiropus splendidus]|uniref:complement component C1q receptor-like n=1 Tax=Synchiropus splendidus TaxID=270530 RepID=UPI00237DFCB9|nr:complement component C1q receptor-like [Synchiropus splendidus]